MRDRYEERHVCELENEDGKRGGFHLMVSVLETRVKVL